MKIKQAQKNVFLVGAVGARWRRWVGCSAVLKFLVMRSLRDTASIARASNWLEFITSEHFPLLRLNRRNLHMRSVSINK